MPKGTQKRGPIIRGPKKWDPSKEDLVQKGDQGPNPKGTQKGGHIHRGPNPKEADKSGPTLKGIWPCVAEKKLFLWVSLKLFRSVIFFT